MPVSLFPLLLPTAQTVLYSCFSKSPKSMILVFLCLPVSIKDDSSDAVCGFLFILCWFAMSKLTTEGPPPPMIGQCYCTAGLMFEVLSLCRPPPDFMFSQWGWFKCSAERIFNNFLGFACWKCPRVSSHYQAVCPRTWKLSKALCLLRERECVCVCKQRAADWVITVTLERRSDAPRVNWIWRLPNTILPFFFLAQTTVWGNLKLSDMSQCVQHSACT